MFVIKISFCLKVLSSFQGFSLFPSRTCTKIILEKHKLNQFPTASCLNSIIKAGSSIFFSLTPQSSSLTQSVKFISRNFCTVLEVMLLLRLYFFLIVFHRLLLIMMSFFHTIIKIILLIKNVAMDNHK